MLRFSSLLHTRFRDTFSSSCIPLNSSKHAPTVWVRDTGNMYVQQGCLAHFVKQRDIALRVAIRTEREAKEQPANCMWRNSTSEREISLVACTALAACTVPWVAVTNTLDVRNKVSVYDTYSDFILCQCIRSTTVALCVSHVYCAISVQHLCESGRHNDCTRLQLLRVQKL